MKFKLLFFTILLTIQNILAIATNVSVAPRTTFSWSKLTVSPAGTTNAFTIMLDESAVVEVPVPSLPRANMVKVLFTTPVLQTIIVVTARSTAEPDAKVVFDAKISVL